MAIEKILTDLTAAIIRQAEATEANAAAGNALLTWYKENNVVHASGSQGALKLDAPEKREQVADEAPEIPPKDTQPTANTTPSAAAETGETVDSKEASAKEPDAADEEVKALETEGAAEQPTKADVIEEMKALSSRTNSLASVNKVLKNYKNKDNPGVPALNIGQINPDDYQALIDELKAA